MNHQPKHPTIAMHGVKSSQIHAIGHDPVTNTMAIQFKGRDGAGSVYHYSCVTPDQFEAFKSAESIGKHFGAHFKQNAKHPFSKIS